MAHITTDETTDALRVDLLDAINMFHVCSIDCEAARAEYETRRDELKARMCENGFSGSQEYARMNRAVKHASANLDRASVLRNAWEKQTKLHFSAYYCAVLLRNDNDLEGVPLRYKKVMNRVAAISDTIFSEHTTYACKSEYAGEITISVKLADGSRWEFGVRCSSGGYFEVQTYSANAASAAFLGYTPVPFAQVSALVDKYADDKKAISDLKTACRTAIETITSRYAKVLAYSDYDVLDRG